jgi:glycosyltransferase involved in cell wall biosynthesis
LARAGYSVELIAHSLGSQEWDPEVKLHSLGDYNSSVAWSITQRIVRCRRAYSLARQSNAAIFHYYSPEFIPWAKRLHESTRRPVIFDCMEDFEAYCYQRVGIPNHLRGVIAHGVRRLLRIAAQSCDAIVVADEATARVFKPYGRNILVLHNFPKLSLFPREFFTGSRDISYDIVYHGSLPKYHLEACLAIDQALIERGREVRWRLLGNIPAMDWFLQELRDRGIAHRFHVTGLIPHDHIAQEIRKAKLGLIPLPNFPKFQSNIPQKLFEFMALGMPVVLSDLPPSRPFVGDGVCATMVPPDNYAAYANAIITLLDDANLRQKMGAEGRRRVQEGYNWEHESQKLIALYREILN